MTVESEMGCEAENRIQRNCGTDVAMPTERLARSQSTSKRRNVPDYCMSNSRQRGFEKEDRVRMLTDAERAELERHAKYLANVRSVAASAMKEQSDGMSKFREGIVLVETEKLTASVGRKFDV